MKAVRFTWIVAVAALCAFSTPTLAQAQGFPARPVRLIVPFPPGQATDIVARMLADRLAAAWSQGVVVENRGGGGGVPGTVAGRDAAPDGTPSRWAPAAPWESIPGCTRTCPTARPGTSPWWAAYSRCP